MCARAQVLIVDFDVHHGNGTQDLFYDDPSVLFVDLHEQDVWPGSGQIPETGAGRGEGYTINVPLPGIPFFLSSPTLTTHGWVYHEESGVKMMGAVWVMHACTHAHMHA